jgi:hypothetical protein
MLQASLSDPLDLGQLDPRPAAGFPGRETEAF